MTKPKTSSVTIRDIAKQAGVSVATVSRFLNRTTHVSEEVAVRLQQIMTDLNYIPHSTARKLATNRTDTIGLLMMDISGDFFTPLLNGIESSTSENGFDLLISSTRHPVRRTMASYALGPNNTDGLLVFANSLREDELRHFHNIKFPVVLIHLTPPDDMKIPCVTVENKAATFKIIEHLIEVHQRKQIVFMAGAEGQEDSYWRELGYKLALEKYHIPCDPAHIVMGGFSRHIAAESMKTLLAAGVPFDAVFAGDDEAAVGVIAVLQEAGIRVPQDVSVVGFDDQSLAPYVAPPLTTVRAPTEEVGRVAARVLIDLIRTGQTDQLTLLPTEIVIRQSCGCSQPTKIH
jgi:DNA-binding LacI/PurR family transcriptional regulator